MPKTFASLSDELRRIVAADPIDMARAALVIAKLEYPRLDPRPSLARLRELGDQAAHATRPMAGAPARDLLATISHELYDKAGFSGNSAHYDDFRNSLLNVVLERRMGIPITLALVFMEVARQANVDVQGVGFPGRFLLRAAGPIGDQRPLILDPFDRGRELGELDCRALLSEMLGDESEYSLELLRPCSAKQMLARMLNNLKRTYVEMRSFPQAYAATDMILAVDPLLLPELRDRGLLAYHLDDFPAALRDLEDYLRLNDWSDDSDRKERDEIWNHVRNLRRRVAGLN